MKLEFLVLDFDGVVNNSRDVFLEVVNEALRHFGLQPTTPDEISKKYRPNPKQFYIEHGVKDYEHFKQVLHEVHRARAHEISAVPGAVEAVQELSTLCPLAVFTANSEENVHRDLARYGLDRYVKQVFCSVDKETTDDFERLLAKANVPRERVLYGGDTIVDIALAQKAGVQSIAIVHRDYGYQEREIVAAHRPEPTHGIVEHVREIIPILKNGF